MEVGEGREGRMELSHLFFCKHGAEWRACGTWRSVCWAQGCADALILNP